LDPDFHRATLGDNISMDDCLGGGGSEAGAAASEGAWRESEGRSPSDKSRIRHPSAATL